MHFARVIGTVVASRKESVLEGLKFLLLEGADPKGESKGGHVVAVDAVGGMPLEAAGAALLLVDAEAVVTLASFD